MIKDLIISVQQTHFISLTKPNQLMQDKEKTLLVPLPFYVNVVTITYSGNGTTFITKVSRDVNIT